MPVYISPIKHNCSSYKVIDLTIALKCINFRLESRVEWVRAQSYTRYIAGIRQVEVLVLPILIHSFRIGALLNGQFAVS